MIASKRGWFSSRKPVLCSEKQALETETGMKKPHSVRMYVTTLDQDKVHLCVHLWRQL
jgi:hypothetical protein